MRQALALVLLALVATGVQAARGAAKDTFVLSVSVSGSGKVTSGDGQISCPGSCSGKYDAKTDVNLTATPDKGSQFSSWSGCDSAKGNSCSVTMTKDRSVDAVFTTPPPPKDTFVLSVSVSGAGQVKSVDGQISCPGSCSGKYDAKTDVNLSAIPDKGSLFSGWKGCDSQKEASCSVTMTKDRSVEAVFTTPPTPPPLPQPPAIRITAPGAGAFFTRPSDLVVTVLVTARSLPTFFCFSVDDARTPPDPCDSATSHGLGNGSYARPVAGLHPGRNTVTAWAIDSHGQPASDSRAFEIASATSGIDLRTQTIEPTQGIQFWGLPRTDVAPGGSRSGVYNGVRLAAGGRTVVRIYADAVSFGRAGSISGARMQLFGYRESGGTLLPGSPLTPIYSPLSLALDSSDVVTPVQRLSPGGAYTFDLPESWTHGTIRLLASLNALGTLPSIPECCYANNSFLLTGLRFYDIDPITITPLQVIWRPSGGTYTRPAPYLEAFADAVNLVPNRVTLYPYRSTVDVSAAYARNPNLSVPAIRDRAEWDVLDAMSDMYDVVGKTGYGVGVSRGWIAGMTGWYLRYGNLASTNSDRPKTSVAHEFGHELGFAHASRCTPPGVDVGSTDDWPPDQRGYIQGIALDRRADSGRGGGPYRIFGGSGWYDFMSYCANINDSDSWISVRNWQRLMGGPATQPDREAIRVLAWRAVGPTLHVVARVNANSVEILRVQPGRGSQTPSHEGAPYQIVVRNAAGAVVSSTGVVPQPVHIDRTRADEAVLLADVPASGAAAIEVASSGVTKASRKASAHAPVVRIVSPTAGSTVGKGPTVTVQWTGSDADGGALTARVDYSRNGGGTWVGVGSTAATAMALPSNYFSASKAARVRVTVNDGFRESTAVSGRFTALGAPPSATILQPSSRGETIPADAALQLVGEGFDDTGTLLPSRALSWFDGKRPLGKGRAVLARDLQPGTRQIRLAARDRSGRTGSAVVRVRVRAVPPYFLRLSGPKQVARTARSVRLLVSSSVRATLRAGGRRFPVDRRVRGVTVPVKPGKGTLSLQLVLTAGGKTARVKLSISRP